FFGAAFLAAGFFAAAAFFGAAFLAAGFFAAAAFFGAAFLAAGFFAAAAFFAAGLRPAVEALRVPAARRVVPIAIAWARGVVSVSSVTVTVSLKQRRSADAVVGLGGHPSSVARPFCREPRHCGLGRRSARHDAPRRSMPGDVAAMREGATPSHRREKPAVHRPSFPAAPRTASASSASTSGAAFAANARLRIARSVRARITLFATGESLSTESARARRAFSRIRRDAMQRRDTGAMPERCALPRAERRTPLRARREHGQPRSASGTTARSGTPT
ncbi:MAG: hypothetical protein RMK90_11760, partial [Acetobacteraceae bacterium]|nr:hypothetical protein [Acetobacteraceae bacterium]